MTKSTKVGFFETLKSTFAGFFGVQSNQQRERDFSAGKPSHFILAGIIATMLFVVLILVVVKILLAGSGL